MRRAHFQVSTQKGCCGSPRERVYGLIDPQRVDGAGGLDEMQYKLECPTLVL